VDRVNRAIADAARANGFSLVGFARIRRLEDREAFYRQWLGEGRHGTMAYLAREPERRLDPRRLDPRIESVVSLGYPYPAPAAPSGDWRAELRGRIAAYALGTDYHDYVLAKARAVAGAIAALQPRAVTRVYVDTGPVFEREWAAGARLGWFGKNTMILNREHGSYFFLAEILTDAELEPSAQPYREHCGTCRRCLDLCPTGALGPGCAIDSRLCISYLTIEHRGSIPVELRAKLEMWIFGCDVCQEVCPWNGAEGNGATADLFPYLPELLALDDAGFSRRFSASAIKRTKRRGLARNVAVVLGNTGNPEAGPHLARALENDPEPLVRAHAAWALGRIGGAPSRRALDRARAREPDGATAAEIDAALTTGSP